MARLTELSKKLAKDKIVKRELKAEEEYCTIVIPIMSSTMTIDAFDKTLKPVLDKYQKLYGDTEFAKTVDGAVAAHKDAILHPNKYH